MLGTKAKAEAARTKAEAARQKRLAEQPAKGQGRKKQYKAVRKADRELRSDLAAGFRADLAAAGGNVAKALARLIPAGKSKAQAKATAKQKARTARKT